MKWESKSENKRRIYRLTMALSRNASLLGESTEEKAITKKQIQEIRKKEDEKLVASVKKD